ncbi:MAG: hypothetical protein J2P18_08710, partial [Nocardia sp.]|nr:hypothetical protein [Nocardia sp.]
MSQTYSATYRRPPKGSTGVLTVHTDYGTSIVPANRIAWTPAHIAHRHSAYGDTDMRIVFLPPTLARRIPDRPAV